jgi:small subunit ribosomal protein S1
VKKSVEKDCNKVIKEINNIVPELQMPDLTIEWVSKDESGQVNLKEGEAIVYLNYQRDNTRNYINTTTAYIKRSLLPNSRNYLSESVRKAIDFTVIKGILAKSVSKNYLMNPFIDDNREDIAQYSDTFEKVTTVDDEGMLTRILLREFSLWGGKLAGHLPKLEHQVESDGFLDFLYELLTREPEELTPLRYVGNDIKVGVILVAKPETYNQYGSTPYLRRIRAGFASGINTFYLLARNEKIDILSNVYSDLITTGYFTLENGPQQFKDTKGRDVICYCIEVNPESDMAKDYTAVKDSISNHGFIEVEVADVKRFSLDCRYNLIPVTIPVEEITSLQDIRLYKYYSEGMTLVAEPLEIEKGVIKASLKNTASNPQRLIDLEYSVGNKVIAVVEGHKPHMLHLLIKDSDQKAIAFRKNVTNSWMFNLEELFPIGSENEYIIKDLDYLNNTLELKLSSIADPWKNLRYHEGQNVSFNHLEENDTCFITELEPGIKAILPFSELTWKRLEIDQVKTQYAQNFSFSAKIKQIVPEKRIVILTLKTKNNPYENYLKSLGNDGLIDVKFKSSDSYGIHGVANGGFEVFVPLSETHIGGVYYRYELEKEYKVKIKEVSERGNSFVGTLKPFIETPLKVFANSTKKGALLNVGRPVNITDTSAYYTISQPNIGRIKASLFVGDITNLCRITIPIPDLVEKIAPKQLIVKGLDFERNRIELSLKQVFANNKGLKEKLQYKTPYRGVVIGQSNMKYVIIVKDLWIEAYLDIKQLIKPGSEITVYLSAKSGEYPEFFE